MKATRWFFNVLLSLCICMSMVFQAPAPVSAQTPQGDETQPDRHYAQFRVNGELRTGKFNVSVTPTGTSAAATSAAPSVSRPGTGVVSTMATTQTIMTEGFEGAWPGANWSLSDASSTDGGEYLFGPVTKKARTGSKSGWEAAGGANGYGPAGNTSYPNNMNTAMVYGPFSLSDAVAGRFTFYYTGSVPAFGQQDGVGIGASNDGTNFTGFTIGGSSSWATDYLDFTNVDGSNTSFLGDPQVWIMVVFQSDGTSSTNEGIYFDDLIITKDTNAPTPCYALTTAVSPSGTGNVAASPAPNCATDNTKYSAGTSVTLTATANAGYMFASWTGATSSTNVATVTINADTSVTANFNPEVCYSLTKSANPTAGGSVAASPAPNCSDGKKYRSGTQVTLTATANTGYNFTSWTGADSSSGATATVTMTSDKTVTANFAQEVCYTLTKSANPSAGGSVAASPAPNCSTDNTKYKSGTAVTLTATVNTGYTLSGWTGADSSSGSTATVTMNNNKTVTANFTIICYTLNTGVSPSSGGTVTRDKNPDCNNNTQYSYGTVVTLTANPADSTYKFSNWTGDVSSSSNPVTVTMNSNKSVTANFTQTCYSLTLSANPSAGGSISANPTPNCNNNTQYAPGTSVTLTASTNTGYKLDGWTGATSSGANTATVTMDSAKTVTANFSKVCYTLTTSINPAGYGTINANVAPDCNGGTQYSYGTQVTLTANPTTGHAFLNWTGAVSSSSNPVTVTIDGNKSITANFTTLCYTLTPSVSPSGSGTITRDKNPDCNNNTQYSYGTVVTLTATPTDSTWAFGSWSGVNSSSQNKATVTMDGNKTVTASFTRICYTLSASPNLANSGTVSTSPAPNCNSSQYITGTKVTLTAAAATGYTFKDWTGATSSGANTATVTVDSNKTVTANFTINCYALTTAVSPSGTGIINVSPAGNCNSGAGYTHGTQVTLTASANATYYFAGWQGAAAGLTNPVTVTMDGAKSVTATFTQEKCFTLTTSVVPTGGGTITADKAPNCSNGLQYRDGTSVTLTQKPNAHYTFDKWTVDGSASSSASVTVVMSANHSVTVNYLVDCFTLTTLVTPTNTGTINANPAPSCSNNTQYPYGTEVTLTAAPKPLYKLDKWTGAATGSTNPVKVTIDGNKTVTANLVLKPCYTLTTAVAPASSGAVSASPAADCSNGTQYTEGSVVQLTATAGPGYILDKWTGDASGTANPVSVTMSGNKAVTANFLVKVPTPKLTAINPNKIKVGSNDQLLTVTGSGFMSASGVRWNGEALTGVTYVSGIELRVTIPAARLATPGTIHITVINEGPGGSTSNTIDLEIFDRNMFYLPFIRK